MAERPSFGDNLPTPGRREQYTPVAAMWPEGDDLPLFSGTPIPVIEKPFVPEDHSMKQQLLPGTPGIDYDAVLANDKALHHRRHPSSPVLPPAGDIFTDAPPAPITPLVEAPPVIQREARKRPRKRPPGEGHQLREALAPYLSLPKLRQLAALGEDLTGAFVASGEIPAEVQALLDTLALLLRPPAREQIRSPRDVAAFLMVSMGYLDQEQMRVVCLNTKNRLLKTHVVYQGNVNTSVIRVGEIFREPLKLNSTAIILAHNHPSGEPEPSPEDVLVTRQIIDAGKLLDVEVLDHLVIGQGRWVSLRERGLGFEKP